MAKRGGHKRLEVFECHMDTAIEQGKTLIELQRLHMFREDTIVFALAVKHVSDDEFSEMERRST